MALWPSLVRAVDCFEGAIGAALNVAVICLLWRRAYTANLMAYRICITVNAVQALLFSAGSVAFAQIAHLFRFDCFVIIVYGEVAIQNESISRFLIYFATFVGFAIWELIPGSCLLQYLTLSKPHLSVAKKFTLSYGLCAAMMFWSSLCLRIFQTSPYYDELVRDAHHPDDNDRFFTMGAFNMPTEGHPDSMLDIVAKFVLPTNAISYGIFGYCIVKSRNFLKPHNVKLSEKTQSMHRKFLNLMVMQNLLPLVTISIPIATLAYSVAGSSLSTGLMNLSATSTLFSLPIVQGAVALTFVLRLRKTPVGVHAKTSLTHHSGLTKQ